MYSKMNTKTKKAGYIQAYCLYWVVVLIVALCLSIILWHKHSGTGQSNSSAQTENISYDFDTGIFEPSLVLHSHHRDPPPMWRQTEANKYIKISGIPVLLLVDNYNISIIQRSIESVLDVTSGSKMNLVVSIREPTSEILKMLQAYPLRVHSTNPLFSRTMPLNLRNIFETSNKREVCVKDPLRSEIKFLHTTANLTEITTDHPTLKDIHTDERGVPYMDNPYSPVYRKAVMNSPNEAQDSEYSDTNFGRRRWTTGSKSGKGRPECEASFELKKALEYVTDSFPSFQHMILMTAGYTLSPDFVHYFDQTIDVLKEDSTIYCISALNPLASPTTSGDEARVYRIDEFVAGGTLMSRHLVEEILRDFVIYEGTVKSSDKKLSHTLLANWLSWWSRRRRRGCVVPDVPRMCPIGVTSAGDAQDLRSELRRKEASGMVCSRQEDIRLVNVSRLLYYRYGQDMFRAISAAEPMGDRSIDCRDPLFYPESMNTSSSYAIYIKMENYDDDFTFHHVMKCLGLDLPASTGYFEGVFRLTFRGAHLLVMAVPYSRFSPAMKNIKALVNAEIPDQILKGRVQYQKYKHEEFSFKRVPVHQIVD